LGEKTVDLATMVTVTGLLKLAKQSGATWQMRLNGPTSYNPTYDIHTKFQRDLIFHFNIMISAKSQDKIGRGLRQEWHPP